MSVCEQLKGFCQRHHWVSDIFSMLGVALLFATIWFLIFHQTELLKWVNQNVILHVPLLVAAIVVDVFMVFGLLCLGSPKCATDENCFRTFPGRRHGTTIGTAFNHWLSHMENVGKKHR